MSQNEDKSTATAEGAREVDSIASVWLNYLANLGFSEFASSEQETKYTFLRYKHVQRKLPPLTSQTS